MTLHIETITKTMHTVAVVEDITAQIKLLDIE